MNRTGWTLTKDSIVYFFTRKTALYLVGIATAYALLFAFLVEGRFHLGIADAYLYEIPRTFLQIFWQIWIVVCIVSQIKNNKRPSFLKTAKESFWHTASAWWLVAWTLLLQWALIPLLEQPYCYNESVDLSLFVLVRLLEGVQILINFFMIPLLVSGEHSFATLFLTSCGKVIKHFRRLLWFFFLYLCMVILIAIGIGIGFVILRYLLDYIIADEWIEPVFRRMWVYLVGFVMMAILGIAQSKVYINSRLLMKK